MKNLLPWSLRAAACWLCLTSLAGCGGAGSAPADAGSPTAQARTLERRVVAQHDSLMDQAERLYALKAQLVAAKVPAQAPVLTRMETANQAMMSWMHAYQAPDSLAPPAQRLAYLRGQQQQLAGIKTQLNAALDSAQATLRRAGR